MQTFIELWSFKPAWTELGPEERGAYMTRIGPQIEAVMQAGVTLVSCGTADRDGTDRAAEWDLFAVWSAPGAEAVRLFEQTVAASGWYDYFEQVNVSGSAVALEQLIGAMVSAPASVAS